MAMKYISAFIHMLKPDIIQIGSIYIYKKHTVMIRENSDGLFWRFITMKKEKGGVFDGYYLDQWVMYDCDYEDMDNWERKFKAESEKYHIDYAARETIENKYRAYFVDKVSDYNGFLFWTQQLALQIDGYESAISEFTTKPFPNEKRLSYKAPLKWL